MAQVSNDTPGGSTSRLFGVELHCTAAGDAHMLGHSKHREPERREPAREEWFGDVFYRKIQRWTDMRRTVDKARDWYRETFIDLKTGQILHHCEEPLSQHRGHGSAKHRT